MRFSLNLLKEFVSIDNNITPDMLAHKFTMIGHEIEEIIDNRKIFDKFIVAEIVEAKKHPSADKLQICSVKISDDEKENLQIVCGAKNARAGIKVVLAKAGAVIPNGEFKIKKSKIRDVESNGMLCSYGELGLAGDDTGIIELDASASVGDSILKALNIDDVIFDLAITPNRGDVLGVYGLARDLSAASDAIKLKKLDNFCGGKVYEADKFTDVSSENLINIEEIDVEDKNISSSAFAFKIDDIDNNVQLPSYINNALVAAGMDNISPIVDIINYITLCFNQPMHAYDASKLIDDVGVKSYDNRSLLNIELLKNDQEFVALNDKKYTLKQGDLVITNSQKNVVALAGVIGGKMSACFSDTKNIIIEVAHFAKDHIITAARRLNIDTDSKYRFEREIDINNIENIASITANLIMKLLGGRLVSIDKSNIQLPGPREINLPYIDVFNKLNLNLTREEVCDILTSLQFECELTTDNSGIKVKVPTYRNDVSIKEDLLEEIIRIYGYDNIAMEKLPSFEGGCELHDIKNQSGESNVNNERFIYDNVESRRIQDITRSMAAFGYDEVITYSFVNSKFAKYFTDVMHDGLYLSNPIASNMNYMRPSILINLIDIISSNINRSVFDMSLFEFGPVFKFDDKNNSYIENSNLSFVKTGNNIGRNIHESTRGVDVFDVKADIFALFKELSIDVNKLVIDQDGAPSYYHPSRSAALYLGKNLLGFIGEIHPKILKLFNLKQNIVAGEVVLSNFPKNKKKFGKRNDFILSNYQESVRDYAFLVDKECRAGDMINYIKNIDKKLIKSVNLFDLYEGDKLEANKKSVAFSVRVQDVNQTLTSEQISALDKKIIAEICDKFNASLRA